MSLRACASLASRAGLDFRTLRNGPGKYRLATFRRNAGAINAFLRTLTRRLALIGQIIADPSPRTGSDPSSADPPQTWNQTELSANKPLTPMRSDVSDPDWKHFLSPNSSRAASTLVSLATRGYASSPPYELAPHGRLFIEAAPMDVRTRLDARRHSAGSPLPFSFMRLVTSPILSPAESDVMVDALDTDDDSEFDSDGGSRTSSLGTSMNQLEFSTDYDTDVDDADGHKTEDEAVNVPSKGASGRSKSVQNMVAGQRGPKTLKKKQPASRRRFGSVTKRKKAGIRKQTI